MHNGIVTGADVATGANTGRGLMMADKNKIATKHFVDADNVDAKMADADGVKFNFSDGTILTVHTSDLSNDMNSTFRTVQF
jgi:hypothetical protein